MTLFEAPPPVILPPLTDDEAPFHVDGDLVAWRVETGRAITLRFNDPYETFLTLDGARVRGHATVDERNLSIWIHRRLMPLWRTLGDRYGLIATLTPAHVLVEDLVDLEHHEAMDHPRLRRELADCGCRLPGFSILDAPANRSELNARLRQLYGAGTTVEVRDEEGGRALRRWRVVVDQA